MSNYEATRYDFDGSNITDVEGVNTGIIVPWSDSVIPTGFLACNGAAVSRSTYAALFAVIGTNYGVGDGSTTFNVPDLTDRTCVGRSPTKSQYSTGGANTVTVTGNVSGSAGNTTISTPLLASHNHPASGAGNNAQPKRGFTLINNLGAIPGGSTGGAGGGGAHGHSASGNFTGGSNSTLQPYLTVKYIIKT